jgi:hypothetical protein
LARRPTKVAAIALANKIARNTEQSADCFSESSPAHSAFALSKS